jgi:hypothetical protein
LKKIKFWSRRKSKIPTIIIDRKNLPIKEPIIIIINPKRFLPGLAFAIIIFIIFITIGALAFPSFALLCWVTFMFILYLYQELPWLRYLKPYKPYLIFDSEGIFYNKIRYDWKEIEKVEFVQTDAELGYDDIRIFFADQKSKTIPFPTDYLNYDFTQILHHIESETEGLTFTVT